MFYAQSTGTVISGRTNKQTEREKRKTVLHLDIHDMHTFSSVGDSDVGGGCGHHVTQGDALLQTEKVSRYNRCSWTTARHTRFTCRQELCHNLFLLQPRITGWQLGIHASPTNRNSATTFFISFAAQIYWLTAGHTHFTYQQELWLHLISLTAHNYWLTAGHTCLTY